MYQVLAKIGQGSGGIVYKALHKRLNKFVIIKQLKHVGQTPADSRKEVDLLKQLKHTYLPQVLDFIQENGQTYTVMDFVDGADMDSMVKSGRKFTAAEVRRYAIQLCSAVKYLHSQNPPIIHSDIKPSNIMLNSSNDICLIDFNVSLVFNGSSQVLGGTFGYAPPEQFGIPLDRLFPDVNISGLVGINRPYIDERSDIFSIGASLYYLLTGIRPRPDYQNIPVDKCGVRASDGLTHIINKAMSLNPSRRYRTADEMLTALNNIGVLSRDYRRLRTRRVVVTSIAAAVTAGSLAVSGIGWNTMSQEKEDKYSEYLRSAEKFADSADTEHTQEYIELASELFPNRVEPYLYGIESISGGTAAERSEKRLEYYNDNLADKSGRIPGEKLQDKEGYVAAANIYALAGESAFYLEDYTQAISLYKESLIYDDQNAGCYRDLAISYVRTGDMEHARSTLNKAETLEISSDNLSIVRGEICRRNGDIDGAIQEFTQAADSASDDYLVYRALLSCCAAAADSTGESALSAHTQTAALIEEYRDISDEYRYTILDMLANEYFLCGRCEAQTADELNKSSSTRAQAQEHTEISNQYFESAAGCFRTVYSEGKLTEFSSQRSFYNLLEKLGHYDECRDLLEYIRESGTASTRYWVPMSECYLCYYEEYSKPETQRDFTAFSKAYSNASAEYQQYLAENPGKTDAAMDQLKKIVERLTKDHILVIRTEG